MGLMPPAGRPRSASGSWGWKPCKLSIVARWRRPAQLEPAAAAARPCRHFPPTARARRVAASAPAGGGGRRGPGGPVNNKRYYEILGVAQDADDTTIKKVGGRARARAPLSNRRASRTPASGGMGRAGAPRSRTRRSSAECSESSRPVARTPPPPAPHVRSHGALTLGLDDRHSNRVPCILAAGAPQAGAQVPPGQGRRRGEVQGGAQGRASPTLAVVYACRERAPRRAAAPVDGGRARRRLVSSGRSCIHLLLHVPSQWIDQRGV